MIRFTCAIVIGLLLTPRAHAQAAQPQDDGPMLPPVSASARYCEGLTIDVPHDDVLEKFCEWVLALNEKLPNILSDQMTARSEQVQGNDYAPLDTVTAKVSYENGAVHYADIKVNNKPVRGSMFDRDGTWTTGEYGTSLQGLFVVRQEAEINFVGSDVGRWKGVYIYKIEIASKNNHSWELTFGKGKKARSLKPSYVARVWLDPATAQIIYLERETTDIAKDFPIRWVKESTTFANTPLNDGTSFVLPIRCVTLSCDGGKEIGCTMNDLKFSNWRKFGAEHRIFSDIPTPEQK